MMKVVVTTGAVRCRPTNGVTSLNEFELFTILVSFPSTIEYRSKQCFRFSSLVTKSETLL